MSRHAEAQQSRKLNANNKTGYKNLSHYNGFYHIHVAGTYIGIKKDLGEALELRNEARERFQMVKVLDKKQSLCEKGFSK